MGLGTMLHELGKLSYPEQYPCFSVLAGKTLVSVEGLSKESDKVIFNTSDGCSYKMYHSQDCCECVCINDIESDVEDFSGALILSAEELQGDTPSDHVWEYEPDSYTWTFYKIETDKGGVFIRWLGESNGYYGEDVSFQRIK